jgi:NAD(P)-dependent dehydrogenase (short-subunit alcohol dehydrogenase family)
MSTFHGRVAVVTGAGSGIGRSLAAGLARRGARLALSDIDEATVAATAEGLRARGAEVIHQRLDVSDRAAMEAYAQAVVGHYGAAHQIFNNAGVGFSRTVLASDYADYERVLAVNLWGVIHGTKAFLPHVIASGAGHIINISSLNGFMAQGSLSHYCTAKFAVRGFTESLRIEMIEGRHPVQVMCVHPGGIKTNIATLALERARQAGLPVSADDEARTRVYNEKLLRMSPDRAAEIILNGVANDRPRVLVGNDARLIDVVVRALPSVYAHAVVALGKRMARGVRA